MSQLRYLGCSVAEQGFQTPGGIRIPLGLVPRNAGSQASPTEAEAVTGRGWGGATAYSGLGHGFRAGGIGGLKRDHITWFPESEEREGPGGEDVVRAQGAT